MTKILVIEDETYVRENLVDLLEANDYEVVCASDGYLGILWILDNMPDLIICDVMMPTINGHEVLLELRSNPTTAAIPFIFLTAMADRPSIRQGMELGADDYLTKPFESEELLYAIKARLIKHDIMKRHYNNLTVNDPL